MRLGTSRSFHFPLMLALYADKDIGLVYAKRVIRLAARAKRSFHWFDKITILHIHTVHIGSSVNPVAL